MNPHGRWFVDTDDRLGFFLLWFDRDSRSNEEFQSRSFESMEACDLYLAVNGMQRETVGSFPKLGYSKHITRYCVREI